MIARMRPDPDRVSDTVTAPVLAAIRAAGKDGLARSEVDRRFAHMNHLRWALHSLARRGLVLPCWRHRGSDFGPPELVYFALKSS